jgi:hypothetical protein
MWMALTLGILLCAMTLGADAQYLGNYTANPYLPPAAPQPPGTFNNPYGNDSNGPAALRWAGTVSRELKRQSV